MKTSLAAWWRLRTPREQRLLLVMAALILVVGIWLLLIRPLNDALAGARERHGEAVLSAAEARARAALLTRPGGAAPASAAPVDAIVAQSATEAGFPIDRLERQGGARATLLLEAVRPQAFFAWVSRMEAERELIVEALSATPNNDQTLAVRVTFRARGG